VLAFRRRWGNYKGAINCFNNLSKRRKIIYARGVSVDFHRISAGIPLSFRWNSAGKLHSFPRLFRGDLVGLSNSVLLTLGLGALQLLSEDRNHLGPSLLRQGKKTLKHGGRYLHR
jgi:hypothetical protein